MYLMSVNPFEPFHLFNLSLWTDSEKTDFPTLSYNPYQPPPPIPTFCTGIFFEELASSSLAAEMYPPQLGSWQGVQLFLHNRDNANRLFHKVFLILSFVLRHMKSDEGLFWKSTLLAVNLEGD